MKSITKIFIVSLGLCLASGWATAQEQMTLSLENADIRKLIDWAKSTTDKSIIIHPNVKGKVSVVAGNPMSKKDAYQVFLSVLQVHGYAAVESQNVIKIIPDAIAKQNSIPMLEDGETREDLVVHIVKVHNTSAAQLINILRPLVPQVGHLAAFPESNSLVVADRASNITKIMRIIGRIDKAGGVDIEVIQLEFASARKIIEMIRELLGNVQKPSNVNVLKFTADERSNSILLTGDPASRVTVRKLIRRLDQPLEGEGNTQVFFLNYALAADMAPILQGISGSVLKNDANQANAKVDVSIQPNEALNALVITAPPALLNTMKGVIAKLDVRRPQVLVEALIVEVTEGFGRDLGVNWQAVDGGNPTAIFSAPGTSNSGGGNDGDDSSNDNSTFPSILGGIAGGLNLGYYSGNDLRATISLMASDTNANILSSPTILALDNEEAEILVGENIPFVTGSVTTTGNGTANPFQTVQRQDVGITLKIKPRINNDDSVTLDIEQKTETVAEAVGAANDLSTRKREIKTRALINNGEVLVLGGLISDEVTNTENKVPVLGDIPLIGHAFKSTNTSTRKSNLMVFIHPIILRAKNSAASITREKYDSLRDEQYDFRHKVDSFFLPSEPPLIDEFPGNEAQTEAAQ